MQDVSLNVRLQVAGLYGALTAARRQGSHLYLDVVGPMIDELARELGIEAPNVDWIEPTSKRAELDEPCPACGGVNGYHACDESERNAIVAEAAADDLEQAAQAITRERFARLEDRPRELVAVEELQAGDQVMTYGEGPCSVEKVETGHYSYDLGGREVRILLAQGRDRWMIFRTTGERIERIVFEGGRSA